MSERKRLRPISDIELSVTEAVGIVNQTLEFAYPLMTVVGELSNVRISKGRWLYFDLKDENAKLSCFGTVYMLPGPIEEGLLARVTVSPRLHPQFGFTANLQSFQLVGEGSIRKAASLLQQKLEKEGLFAPERKRSLPQFPEHIALIASDESAAYSDFIKIVKARWPLLKISLYPVLVQGVGAPAEIVAALQDAAVLAGAEAIVLTRGGGSADDLVAFNDEKIVRAIAASRLPTLVAIGHERDVSLAELAADVRASTPSNAAEILVPDRKEWLSRLNRESSALVSLLQQSVTSEKAVLQHKSERLGGLLEQHVSFARRRTEALQEALQAYNPESVLRRGYAIVRSGKNMITTAAQARKKIDVELTFKDGSVKARVQ